tara:strand:+ start:99 stop:245 length:147 start_codon:yes stop_codon:yes gene_type:complete
MRAIMKLFFLIIVIGLTAGVILVTISDPAINQETVTKQIPYENIEIDE